VRHEYRRPTCATNIAGTGDEAGGFVTGIEDQLHAADPTGRVRGEIDAAIHRIDDDIAGGDQCLCLDRPGEQGQRDSCGGE